MTVKNITMKTSDLDMKSESVQNYLQDLDNTGGGAIGDENSRINVTKQQKTKYILHWVLLLGVHFYIFWYIPITGNYVLYNGPECDYTKKEFYTCKNFHDNPYLRILYILFLLFLIFSAKQLAYGFPMSKKPSSVLQYYRDECKLMADIFVAAPFTIEIRCLLDFTFAETSLDCF